MKDAQEANGYVQPKVEVDFDETDVEEIKIEPID
jgi:hypothetical protein